MTTPNFCKMIRIEDRWECPVCSAFIIPRPDVVDKMPRNICGNGVVANVRDGIETGTVEAHVMKYKGAGSYLHDIILAMFGAEPTKKCNCNDRIKVMNTMGHLWCRDNIDEIVGWLISEIKSHKWEFGNGLNDKPPWMVQLAKLLIAVPGGSLPVKWRCKMIVNAAIEQAYAAWKDAVKPLNVPLIDVFERVYCITLLRRPDRWEQFTQNLSGIDWPFHDVIKYPAVDGKKCKPPKWWHQGNGAWGCYRSHVEIIEKCLNEGVKSVLLLEDDALFASDFASKAGEFFRKIPDDWGMLYLGGQHLKANKRKPFEVVEDVYVPFNVNRTHAWALRGRMMNTVYLHLCSRDWKNRHHIDHHLGRLVQKRAYPIYCPKQWIVAQGANKSDIAGRTFKRDRWWKSAVEINKNIVSTDTPAKPFYAIIGLHSSGSSALAGLLWHLGMYLGDKLTGYYGHQPGKNCGYEAIGLAQICENAIRFPQCRIRVGNAATYCRLKRWILRTEKKSDETGKPHGGKYPMLCRLGPQLRNICNEHLRIIVADRQIEESIASLIRREHTRISNGRFTAEQLERHQRWLDDGKNELIDSMYQEAVLRIDYSEMLADPASTIKRLSQYTGLEPTQEQIDAAIRSIDPNKQHVRLTA